MRQMPDEVTHDPANNQAGNELEEPKDMERDSWVVAWGGLRSPIECFEHCDCQSLMINTARVRVHRGGIEGG